LTRADHFNAGTEQDDRYKGETDGAYKRRKAMERKMADHERKYPSRSDPFAGIPQDEEHAF
jgi:hypothetical protein